MFDRLAGDHEAVGPSCFASFGRRLVEAVSIEAGQRVLDIACGRGAVLFGVAKRVSADTIVGINLSEEMVTATDAEAQRRGQRAPAHVMDAERLEFADATFSRVLCGFGLMSLATHRSSAERIPAGAAAGRTDRGVHLANLAGRQCASRAERTRSRRAGRTRLDH